MPAPLLLVMQSLKLCCVLVLTRMPACAWCNRMHPPLTPLYALELAGTDGACGRLVC
jgi:hypothetical protein